jgi:hypothetical protein
VVGDEDRAVAETYCRDQPEVFRIDSVAEDYFSGSDQEYWDLTKDFHSLEPPSPLAWFEYRMPRVIRSRRPSWKAGWGC